MQKHKSIMGAKMVSQLIISCLVVQFLLLLLFIQLMVPLLHRELALYVPIARLEQTVKINKVFLLHATRERFRQWPHDEQGNIKMTGRELSLLDYQGVFAAPESHLSRAFGCSFVPWIIFPLGLRFFTRTAVQLKQDEHSRGARLISEKELEAKNDGTGILVINRIIIPDALYKRHLPVAGQTGLGKTTVLFQHLGKIQKMRRRAILNDSRLHRRTA